MIGSLWGTNCFDAENKLKEIIIKYLNSNINISLEQYSSNNYSIIFSNGDRWEAIKCTENARGKKCNISYIQNSISNLSIETIIRPCTIANPFQAFNYFG